MFLTQIHYLEGISMVQYASNYGEPFLAKNHSTLLYLGGSAVQELLLLVKPSSVHQCCKRSMLLHMYTNTYKSSLTHLAVLQSLEHTPSCHIYALQCIQHHILLCLTSPLEYDSLVDEMMLALILQWKM